MEIYLNNQTAVVTGGAIGLGKVLTLKLAKAGANVVLTSRYNENFSWIHDLEPDLKRKLYPLCTDVSTEHGISVLGEFIRNEFEYIDVLVNNVGHTLEVTNAFSDLPGWKRVIDLNLLAHIAVTNEFVEGMKQRGYGRIINITSIAGLEVSGPAPFNVSKAALTAYTRSVGRLLAIEAPGVVMTAVAPGIVVTEGGHWQKILNTNPQHAEKYLKERSALGRFGTEDEVTDIVVFLASAKASFFHGSIIQVDGGQSRHYMYQNFLD